MTDATAERLAAREIACLLQEHGYTAWLAGGCVRDELLGRPPKDYDIATDAVPEQVLRIFPRALEVGEAFGVLLVKRSGFVIEVATFRREGGYTDGRRPDTVHFTDAATDAQRRDFTINGLFRDPVTDEIHDFVDGRADLEARVLRAIGDPDARFEEDHLRMLRAARFAAAMRLEVDPATREAIEHRSANLAGISRERIGDEFRLMLSGPDPVGALGLLECWGLDKAILGQRADGNGHARLAAVVAEELPLPARLAATALDRGADEDRDGIVRSWRTNLLLSNQERDGMAACLEIEIQLPRWATYSVPRRKRLAAGTWFEAARCMIDAVDEGAGQAIAADVEKLARTGLSPVRLVTGDDLVAAGVMPGPAMGDVLERVYDAQLSGEVQLRQEALDLALRLARWGS